jgi:hypothetical protein
MDKEEWRPVKGNESTHEVSNKGRVRSLTRRVNSGQTGGRLVKGKILKLTKTKQGYLCVNLGRKVGVKLVHILVCQAFKDNPEGKRTVNHENGIKTDDRAENLSWNTHKENNEHAIKTGLNQGVRGTLNYNCRFTEEQVEEIMETIRTTDTSFCQIARDYNVGHTAISDINRGRYWGWLKPEIERPIRPLRKRKRNEHILRSNVPTPK